MEIDFKTGKVSYTDYLNEDPQKIRQSLEDMKIKDAPEVEPVFSKTVHQNLKYGRLKFMFYCFLLMMDGLVGVISIGQTQSIMANKYLLSDYVMGDYDADRQNRS
jgi:cytoskeletal protein RodZ